ncbi:succinyl-CoA:3-ketoacid-coenzyme A transferase subunit B [Rickettsia canadensis str. CA410]|uniref:Succinyl-CoA:3-ketoacid-coenzyme A transferase subunit B n=1 Tax=Rickettsia canadensis str. CA410 TaxID=1105107 RepID=A0ABN4AA83_RICCA|nr:succinyl-CoA:3-ketoacid-coenzyme A transferase subunit B [Rickettsia canadensis str. CA410]
MEHNAKDSRAKLLKEYSFPLTGKKVVNRIITDLGIFDINKEEMVCMRKVDNVTIEEIRSKTEAEYIVNLLWRIKW